MLRPPALAVLRWAAAARQVPVGVGARGGRSGGVGWGVGAGGRGRSATGGLHTVRNLSCAAAEHRAARSPRVTTAGILPVPALLLLLLACSLCVCGRARAIKRACRRCHPAPTPTPVANPGPHLWSLAAFFLRLFSMNLSSLPRSWEGREGQGNGVEGGCRREARGRGERAVRVVSSLPRSWEGREVKTQGGGSGAGGRPCDNDWRGAPSHPTHPHHPPTHLQRLVLGQQCQPLALRVLGADAAGRGPRGACVVRCAWHVCACGGGWAPGRLAGPRAMAGLRARQAAQAQKA